MTQDNKTSNHPRRTEPALMLWLFEKEKSSFMSEIQMTDWILINKVCIPSYQIIVFMLTCWIIFNLCDIDAVCSHSRRQMKTNERQTQDFDTWSEIKSCENTKPETKLQGRSQEVHSGAFRFTSLVTSQVWFNLVNTIALD